MYKGGSKLNNEVEENSTLSIFQGYETTESQQNGGRMEVDVVNRIQSDNMIKDLESCIALQLVEDCKAVFG